MLHHFKGKRFSTRAVLSWPVASEIHFLTFVLVLKLVEYTDTSRGEKKGEGKEATKMFCALKQPQKNQLPPMTITRCFIHLGDKPG